SLIRRSRESRLSRRNTGWLDIDSCPGAGTIFRFEDKSKPWLSSCVKTGRRGSASHGVSGNRRKTRFSEGDKLPRPVRCSGYGIGGGVFLDPNGQRARRRSSPHARALLYRCRGNQPEAHPGGGLALRF